MQKISLYRYTRSDGGITHSLSKPDNAEYTIVYRLIADEGKELINGDIRTTCIDTNTDEGWSEVDADSIEEEPIV